MERIATIHEARETFSDQSTVVIEFIRVLADRRVMTLNTAEQRLPLRRLACARCGTTFECGSGSQDAACWCMDESFRLPMPEAGAGDCLCPACLRAKAATSTA
jgi:hypothetical protein